MTRQKGRAQAAGGQAPVQREKEAREANKRAEKLLEELREDPLWPDGVSTKYW